MKKILFPFLAALLTFVLVVPASAAQRDSKDDNLIAPLEDAFFMNETSVDEYLKLMGFNENELSPLSLNLKKEIASKGGKKVKVEELSLQEKIVDVNGKEVMKNSIGIQAEDNNKLSLFGIATKTASGSKENTYDIYAQYSWSSRPNFAFTDTLAMAWQSKVTPYGKPYSVHNWRNDPFLHQFDNKIQKQQNEGDSFELNLLAVDAQQDGYARQTVKVSTDYEGTTGSVAIGYAHKLVPGVVTAILNYFSIDF